jgi:plastocyanin
MKCLRYASWFVLLALIVGCNNSGKIQNSTDMRTLHASIDLEAIDVLIDGDAKARAVTLGTVSTYANFDSGTHTVTIQSSASGTALATKTLSLASKATQTLVVYGKRNALATVLLPDDSTDPASGNFKVRALGLSPDVGPVDVYLASGDIGSLPATISGAAYGVAAAYVEVPSGNFPFTFTTAGSKEILFQSPPLDFAAGTKNTLAVFPGYSGKLVNAELLTEGSGASGTYYGNKNARLKLANAVADSSALNFLVDGAALFSSVTFKGISSYATTAAGKRTIRIQSSAAPGTTIASFPVSLDSAHDYSLVAVGSLAQPTFLALTDDDSPPTVGLVKVRFVNVSTGVGTVDALVDFASQAAGIAPGSVSAYVQVGPATSYTVTFTTPGGVNAIASLNPVQLAASGVYSIYLFGSGDNAEIRVTRDQ